MKIGVLGSGSVGKRIGTALIKKGHEVMLGSRQAGNEKAKTWKEACGAGALEGSFSDAALYGELIFICLNGSFVLEVLQSIDAALFTGKIVIDVTNPLDFSAGMPPAVLPQFKDVSLGETIQETLPEAYVVKALNTITYKLMVDARIVNEGNHNLFICGDNEAAKTRVKEFLNDNFYWQPASLIDLGDIKAARCTEAIVPFWVMVGKKLNTSFFNFKVVQ